MQARPGGTGQGKRKAVLDGDTQEHIGRLLKASYEELLNQPLPDKLMRKLEELERRERDKK